MFFAEFPNILSSLTGLLRRFAPRNDWMGFGHNSGTAGWLWNLHGCNNGRVGKGGRYDINAGCANNSRGCHPRRLMIQPWWTADACTTTQRICHCEEQSDEAIQLFDKAVVD